MNDLITNATADTTAKPGATATGIASRANISLMGRFITTGAGGIRTLNTDGTTLKPLDAIIRAFAGGTFGAAKAWNNTSTLIAPTAPIPGVLPAAAYFGALGLPASAYTNIAYVVSGTFHSADLQIDPAIAATATSAGVDLTTLAGGSTTAQGATNPYSYTTGITQAVRASGQLAGFYNTDRQVPFIYFIPTGGAANYPTVIFQHGITSQKEAAAAAANTSPCPARPPSPSTCPCTGPWRPRGSRATPRIPSRSAVRRPRRARFGARTSCPSRPC